MKTSFAPPLNTAHETSAHLWFGWMVSHLREVKARHARRTKKEEVYDFSVKWEILLHVRSSEAIN